MFVSKDNKLLKRLNDINQDAKTIFGDSFTLYPNGIIEMDDNQNRFMTGTHYGLCEINNLGFNPIALSFNSRNYYRIMKNIKKTNISGLEINDYGDVDIVFTGIADSDLLVTEKGIVVKIIPRILTSVITENTPSISFNLDGFYDIGDETVVSLVENARYYVDINGYRCRITKQLIPGLKKSHKVYAKIESTDTDDIGLLTMIVNRGSIKTFHQYKFYML